ncbi:hypothetical protein [Nereida sp. MMG025]|uniref:hypothetical protein n=1 Tax=Nereida sp. MMG025 TaxID=2909981 RepID=UPI001F2492EB|nr:hypothetical protein [Nereida sp. MMG025]MCF6446105.1 hypothetical protein [Nereida sp. MMG025]
MTEHSWILSVFEDIEEYCEINGLERLSTRLVHMHGEVQACLEQQDTEDADA